MCARARKKGAKMSKVTTENEGRDTGREGTSRIENWRKKERHKDTKEKIDVVPSFFIHQAKEKHHHLKQQTLGKLAKEYEKKKRKEIKKRGKRKTKKKKGVKKQPI